MLTVSLSTLFSSAGRYQTVTLLICDNMVESIISALVNMWQNGFDIAYTITKWKQQFLPHSDLWQKPVGWAEEWLYNLTPTQPPTQPPDQMDCKTF